MLSFNIDFLTNNLHQNRPRTERTYTTIVSKMCNVLNLISKRKQNNIVRSAFLQVLANPRPKIQKLQIIQAIIKRRLQSALFSIRRYNFKSHRNQIMQKQKQFNYPFSILLKVTSLKINEFLEQGFFKLRVNKRNKEGQQKILRKIQQFASEYLKRNILAQSFRTIELASNKSSQYAKHIKYFQYVFESMRMRIQFDTFAALSVKNYQKKIVDVQTEKGQKRILAHQGTLKRNQMINELKRKLYNMKGQVNEAQILNNKKRVDGSRQNGQKLIKKNEQMRVIQINSSYLQYDLFNLQKQMIRKQDFIKGRDGNKMSFQQLKSIYEYIRYIDTEKDGKLVYSKLIPASKQKQIENKNTIVIAQNVKLKHLMSLYEKIGENKKTDSYNSGQSQNSSLKMLISSLLRTKFMQPQKQHMLQSCNLIEEKLMILNKERENLKNI